jgi:hypothetical protein
MPTELEEFEQMIMGAGSSTTNRNQPPDLSISTAGQRQRTIADRRREASEAKYMSSDGTPISVDESPLSGSERAGLSFRRTPEDQINYLEDTLGYGKNTVRMVGDTPVVRVLDSDTGKERDVLVDEDNLTLKDLSDMSSVIPEVVGSIVSLIAASRGRAGGKAMMPKGWLGKTKHFLTQSAIAAAGGQTAGGIADVSTRFQDMPDDWNLTNEGLDDIWDRIKPGEIVKHRLVMGLIDTATGGVMEGAGAAINRAKNMVRNPFARGRGEIENDMIAAALYIESKLVDPATGKNVKILDHLPVGATTGNQMLARGETFVGKVLSGSGPLGKSEAELIKTLSDAMNVVVGKEKLPTDYDLGAKIVASMQEVLNESGKKVKKAKWNVQQIGSAEIKETLLGQTGKDAGLARDKVGSMVRAAVISKRDEAKKRWSALYSNVENLASQQKDGGKIFSTDEIKRVAADIERNLPTMNVAPTPTTKLGSKTKKIYNKKGDVVRTVAEDTESTVAAGVRSYKKTAVHKDKGGTTVQTIVDEAEDMGYDQYGELSQVIGKNAKGESIHPAYYPDSLRKFLNMQRLGEKQTLSQLRTMRTVVNDAIRDNTAMPGVGAGNLKRISSAITKSIEKGVDKIPDKQLKNALNEANSLYRNNHSQFRDLRVAKYFKTPDQSGYMGDMAIVNELIEKNDGDMWNNLRDYFTKGMKNSKGVTEAPSKEMLDAWESLKLSYVDGIISKSTDDPFGRQVNAGQLINNLAKVGEKAPNIVKEAFGGKLPRVLKITNLMQEAKDQSLVLDRDLIVDYLGQRTTTRKALGEYIKQQKARDNQLKNDIIGPFMQGDDGALDNVPVDRLVDRFIERGNNTGAIEGFMDRIKSMPDGDRMAEEIQRKVIVKLFKKTLDPRKGDTKFIATRGFGVKGKEIDEGYSGVPSQVVSGKNLAKELEDKKEFYENLLHPDQLEMIKSIGQISAGIEKRDELGGVAGSLVGGGLMRKILADSGTSKLAAGYELSKYWIASAIVSSKTLRKWAASSYQWGEMPMLYKSLLLTAPVLRAAAEDMDGPEEFWMYLDAMRKEQGIKPNDEFQQMIDDE